MGHSRRMVWDSGGGWKRQCAAVRQTRPLIPPTYLAPRFEVPPNAPSSIVIAVKGEPGERLIVSGRVLDGARPVAGVSIYVVQADANGRYSTENPDTDLNATTRLYGFMRSDT